MDITVHELATELGAIPDDILAALAALREFTLGPDSIVRHEAADHLRARWRELATEEASSSGSGDDERALDWTSPARPRPKPRGRNWRPGDDPLPTPVHALADQIARFAWQRHRNPDQLLYADEITAAKTRHLSWLNTFLDRGVLIDDSMIVSWVRAFREQNLDPGCVVDLVAAGIAPHDARLRLWYGKSRTDRPMILDRVTMGDITARQAKIEIDAYHAARDRTA